jgi:hypothetical protein
MESTKPAVCAYDMMAGHEPTNAITPHRRTDGARGTWSRDRGSELAIGHRFARISSHERSPNLELKSAADQMQRNTRPTEHGACHLGGHGILALELGSAPTRFQQSNRVKSIIKEFEMA